MTENTLGYNSKENGILYIVSTPIGNLDDITLRAIRILGQVDGIAAESVSRTRGLLSHFQINTSLISYREANHRQKAVHIIRLLKEGKEIALVSDAGTPTISDPGAYLVDQAYNSGIKVIPVPGPSAVTAALSASGFTLDRYLFIGFLPNRQGRRRNVLKELKKEPGTIVFYEAPHRLKATLLDIQEIFPTRKIALFKEMTKVYEEIKRGLPGEILEELRDDWIRGEFTIVLSGRKRGEDIVEKDETDLEEMIDSMLEEKGRISTRDMAKAISEETGIPYRKVYRICIKRIRDAV